VKEEWLATVRSVIAAAEASDVFELEVRSGAFRIALRRVRDPNAAASPLQTRGTADHAGAALGIPPGWHVLEAPLTGIWYDAPAPGAAPYVAVGDNVAPGTIIGLVETMKVFNEVAADVGGIVRQVLVQRGDLVPAHAPLLVIDPTGASSTDPRHIA
jgi:acetyl-CoA carboxylase biotin carboxyl carrier protein